MAHWRTTPSHAWLFLSGLESERIPDFARRDSYEEDCEWSIAVLALPELVNQSHLFDSPIGVLDNARQVCCNWYPSIFEKLTGEKPTLANSYTLRKDKFHRDNKDNWIVICAWGDWKEGTPKGYVTCLAALGGERDRQTKKREYLVIQSTYKARSEFGYVIQPIDERVN